jgi:pimeloyl-ACP methyl ester carboxylesterase
VIDDTAPPPLSLLLRELAYVAPVVLSPLREARPVAGARYGGGQPVMVVPGLVSNDMATALLRRTLDATGYRAYPPGLGLLTGITQQFMARAAARLAEVAQTEQRKVALMGWSLGGLYARVLAQRHPELVELVMTLGTPFSGSRRANNAWRLYEALNDHTVDNPPVPDDPSLKPPVPTVALWSRSDGVIAAASARGLPHERDAEIEVPFTHLALATSRPAIDRVIAELGEALAN